MAALAGERPGVLSGGLPGGHRVQSSGAVSCRRLAGHLVGFGAPGSLAGWPTMLGNIKHVKPHFHAPKGQPMSTLQTQFEQAVAESKSLPDKPDNMTLLKIYALYKQASAGDVDGKRPGFTDMVGRAKWDAWNGLKGTTSEAAMQDYIDLIESLK